MSEELPEWARITSDLAGDDTPPDDTFDGVPLPVASPGTASPSRPGRPSGPAKPPAKPSAVPVPEAPAPQPSSPVQPVVTEPVTAPSPQPAPTPVEPVEEPRFDDIPDAPQQDSGGEEPDVSPHLPPRAPKPVPSSKKKRLPGMWKTSGSGDGSSPPPVSKGNARWRVIALRVAVWSVLAIVALAGLRAIIAPPRVSTTAIADAVAAEYGLNNFPEAEGEAVSLAFARIYLTYSPESGQARTDKLRSLVADDLVKAPWLQESTEKSQSVVAGPYLLEEPTIGPEQFATYKVRAGVIDPAAAATAKKNGEILNPSWVYLSIPIFWADNGGVSVSGPPAFIPGYPNASQSGSFNLTYDNEASQSARIDLRNFFVAWSESDSVALARYTKPDSTAYVLAGLGNTVSLNELDKVQVEASADPYAPRFAQATVRWNYRGTEMAQGYRLEVVQDEQGRWYVLDLVGGDYPAK